MELWFIGTKSETKDWTWEPQTCTNNNEVFTEHYGSWRSPFFSFIQFIWDNHPIFAFWIQIIIHNIITQTCFGKRIGTKKSYLGARFQRNHIPSTMCLTHSNQHFSSECWINYKMQDSLLQLFKFLGFSYQH